MTRSRMGMGLMGIVLGLTLGWLALVTAGENTSSGWAIVHLGTTLSCEDQTASVCRVEQRFSFTNITLAAPTTTVIKSGAGFLHLITINKTAATGVITCYDNTSGAGTVIATITQPAAVLQSQETLLYDVVFATGLTCVTATAAQDITVSYR